MILSFSACQLNPFASDPQPALKPPPTPTIAPPTATPLPPTDVISHLRRDGRFTRLLDLLEGTNLDSTIINKFPITLLAPTDRAFSLMPIGMKNLWLDQTDTSTDLIRYHLIFGDLTQADIGQYASIGTVLGPPLSIYYQGAVLNEAWIISSDVTATNGTIHVIDSVLIPPLETTLKGGHILEVLQKDGRFNALVASINATSLAEKLNQPGPFTLFAPTDEAILALPTETLTELANNPTQFANILRYHLISGQYTIEQALSLKNLESDLRLLLFVHEQDGQVKIDGQATIIKANIEASNGIMHIIDRVLIPLGE